MVKKVDVAAAVIRRADGSFLLGQRAADTFYAGYWEFPGGKVEPGETPHDALVRELDEELGIKVTRAYPWIMREHHYEHAHVRLHFFEVAEWSGSPVDHVHSSLSWQQAHNLTLSPMLPANGPILKALRLPREMGITYATQIGMEKQLALLDAALAKGLKFVQIREPRFTDAELEEFVPAVVARCHSAGAIVVINGQEELARRFGADGIHLPAHQLASTESRPNFEWVGASCHSREELERVASLGLDYAQLGHVQPTISHPGEPALGWERFAELAALLPMPVLGVGGLNPEDMRTAFTHGAHGIAMIRSAW